MTRTELEARVIVLERLVTALLRQLHDAERIDEDDLEAIINSLAGPNGTPAVMYLLDKLDRRFPPQHEIENARPRHISEVAADWTADAAEQNRVFGPPDK